MPWNNFLLHIVVETWQQLWSDKDYQWLWISRILVSAGILVLIHLWEHWQGRKTVIDGGSGGTRSGNKTQGPSTSTKQLSVRQQRQKLLQSLKNEGLPEDLVLEEITDTPKEAENKKNDGGLPKGDDDSLDADSSTKAPNNNDDDAVSSASILPKTSVDGDGETSPAGELSLTTTASGHQTPVGFSHKANTSAAAAAAAAAVSTPSSRRPQQQQGERHCTRPASTTITQQSQQNQHQLHPPFLNHPPNKLNAFWDWCDTEASLFRIYAIATNTTNATTTTRTGIFTAMPPFNPSSRRGNVRVSLRVTNRMTRTSGVQVYWIDYKGHEIPKGTIRFGETWLQTTWIDHPWVFRTTNDGQVLMYYVPYRIIPSTPDDSMTINPNDNDDPTIGIHRFTLRDAGMNDTNAACAVDDPLFPFPARDHLKVRSQAIEWALQHCFRMDFQEWELLLQYTRNILLVSSCDNKTTDDGNDDGSNDISNNNNKDKYRSIRLANRAFASRIWNSPARGVLLAAGFHVNQGSHLQFGGQDFWTNGTNSRKDLSEAVWRIELWQQRSQRNSGATRMEQPVGAFDGYGRAGFGRAGVMNTNNNNGQQF